MKFLDFNRQRNCERRFLLLDPRGLIDSSRRTVRFLAEEILHSEEKLFTTSSSFQSSFPRSIVNFCFSKNGFLRNRKSFFLSSIEHPFIYFDKRNFTIRIIHEIIPVGAFCRSSLFSFRLQSSFCGFCFVKRKTR